MSDKVQLNKLSRRQFLYGSAALGALVLAGCAAPGTAPVAQTGSGEAAPAAEGASVLF